MSFMPIIPPAGASLTLASYLFNGTDEYLTHTWATVSPAQKRFTVSLWYKTDAVLGDDFDHTMVEFNYNPNNSLSIQLRKNTGNIPFIYTRGDTSANSFLLQEFYDSSSLLGAWHHLVCRYDSTQASGVDRCRIYLDGLLVASTASRTPNLNDDFPVFTNSTEFNLGVRRVFFSDDELFKGSIAFVDIAYDASLPPTDFAFNNGGIWTRKPFAGAYGAYGLSLDGSDGFNDVSGNNLDMTPVNMGMDNLDAVDLPPFVV